MRIPAILTMAVATTALLTAGCGTKKETVTAQSSRASVSVSTTSLHLSDTVAEHISLAIDSPEIRIFRPGDSSTVRITAQRAVFTRDRAVTRDITVRHTDSATILAAAKTSTAKESRTRSLPSPTAIITTLLLTAALILILRLKLR